jgi:hypothetical protein
MALSREEILYGLLFSVYAIYMRYAVGLNFLKSIFSAAIMFMISYVFLLNLNNVVLFYKAKNKIMAFLYLFNCVFVLSALVGLMVYAKSLAY